MSHVEKSIDVNVPLSTAYNQWTQFEEFPQFMEGVREVRQLDNKRLHWRANIGGKDVEWDAVITEQLPDQRIAWKNMTGAENAGTVSFEKLAADSTCVNLQMDYDTSGFLEAAADRLGFVTRRVEGDLERFKQFIEMRGQETGAWRGAIGSGSIADRSDAAAMTAGSASTVSGDAARVPTGADYAGPRFAGPSAAGARPGAGSFEGMPAQGAPVANATVDAYASTGLSTTAQGAADPVGRSEDLPREEGNSGTGSRPAANAQTEQAVVEDEMRTRMWTETGADVDPSPANEKDEPAAADGASMRKPADAV